MDTLPPWTSFLYRWILISHTRGYMEKVLNHHLCNQIRVAVNAHSSLHLQWEDLFWILSLNPRDDELNLLNFRNFPKTSRFNTITAVMFWLLPGKFRKSLADLRVWLMSNYFSLLEKHQRLTPCPRAPGCDIQKKDWFSGFIGWRLSDFQFFGWQELKAESRSLRKAFEMDCKIFKWK